MKKLLDIVYVVLKVICWIWIVFWLLMGLVLRTTEGQPVLLSGIAVVFVIAIFIPVPFLLWRYIVERKKINQSNNDDIKSEKYIKTIETKDKVKKRATGKMVTKIISMIWCFCMVAILLYAISEDNSIATISVLVLIYPALMYLILKSKVFTKIKDNNSNVTNIKTIIISFGIIVLIGIILNVNYTCEITSIRVSDVKIEKLDNIDDYNETEDNYAKGIIHLYFNSKGTGEYWFNKEVKIRNIDNKSHPYYKEAKIIVLENDKLEVDKLTNGKYLIEIIAYKSNPDNKTSEQKEKISYTVSEEFVVENGYDSKEQFLKEYNIVKKEKEARLVAEEERRKHEDLVEGPAKEKDYREKVIVAIEDIGRSVKIIEQAYNTSDFETHASEIKSLIEKCNKLKDLSAPTSRYYEVDKLINNGCDKYIESSGNMAKGVLEFDTSYFDLAEQQSREAGKYFENAIYKMED